jgi:hypothetical protein
VVRSAWKKQLFILKYPCHRQWRVFAAKKTGVLKKEGLFTPEYTLRETLYPNRHGQNMNWRL